MLRIARRTHAGCICKSWARPTRLGCEGSSADDVPLAVCAEIEGLFDLPPRPRARQGEGPGLAVKAAPVRMLMARVAVEVARSMSGPRALAAGTDADRSTPVPETPGFGAGLSLAGETGDRAQGLSGRTVGGLGRCRGHSGQRYHFCPNELSHVA